MEACIGQLRRSLADKDMNTFDYGLKAMAYLLDTCYETSESRNNVWNFYKKIFELSEEIQRLNHKKENYHNKILLYQTEWRELIPRINGLKKSNRNISEEAEMNVLIKRAVECKREIDDAKKNLNINKSLQFTWKQSIDNLDQHILEIQSGHSVDVQTVLAQAMDMHHKILEHNMGAMKEVSRLTKNSPEMTDYMEEPSLTDPAAFEKYFQELRQELDKMESF